MLLRLAWPNIAVMLIMASTGLIETWWVSRLGLDALAGVALVFPGFMMMQMLSAGAMGGGISSAVARALGSGRRDDADALVAGAARDRHQRRARKHVCRAGGRLRPLAVPGARRRGRLARSGARLLQYRLCRHAFDLANERAGERDPGHRQYAGAGARGQRRCHAARAAVAVPDLRPGTVSGARDRRGRNFRRFDHGANGRGTGRLSRIG